MAQSPEWPDLKWVPPKSYSTGRPVHACSSTGLTYPGRPRFITIHYTAGAEGYTNAEGGAAYDQTRTDGTSSHFYIDADSVVQCVRTTDRSHTAKFHGNQWGIHYEQCGTAQTRAQWLDPVSRATIRNTAWQAARDMTKWGIPLVRVGPSQLRSPTTAGVCGHVDWTRGWPEDNGTHEDPGPEYPWDVLFADLAAFLNGDDDMNLTDLVKLPADAFPEIGPQKSDSVENCLGWGLARSLRIELQNKQTLDLLAALAKQVGVAQADIDDIQARTGSVTLSDAQVTALTQQVTAALIAAPDNPLTDADLEAVGTVVEAKAREVLASTKFSVG